MSVLCEKLSIKKYLKVALYDDVMGTMNVAVLTKFCNSSKVTYYPGFFENYGSMKTGGVLSSSWLPAALLLQLTSWRDLCVSNRLVIQHLWVGQRPTTSSTNIRMMLEKSNDIGHKRK